MAFTNIITYWVTIFLLSDTASTPLREKNIHICMSCLYRIREYILYVRRNVRMVPHPYSPLKIS